MVIVIMFTLIFSQSLTLEIRVAMPFSSRVKRDSEGRDNQAFLVENVFFGGDWNQQKLHG